MKQTRWAMAFVVILTLLILVSYSHTIFANDTQLSPSLSNNLSNNLENRFVHSETTSESSSPTAEAMFITIGTDKETYDVGDTVVLTGIDGFSPPSKKEKINEAPKEIEEFDTNEPGIILEIPYDIDRILSEGKPISLEGILIRSGEETFDRGIVETVTYRLRTNDNREYTLVGNYQLPQDTISGSVISVKGILSGGSILVDSLAIKESTPLELAGNAEVNALIIPVSDESDPLELFTQQEIETAMFSDTDISVKYYFDEVSANAYGFSGTVFDWQRISYDESSPFVNFLVTSGTIENEHTPYFLNEGDSHTFSDGSSLSVTDINSETGLTSFTFTPAGNTPIIDTITLNEEIVYTIDEEEYSLTLTENTIIDSSVLSRYERRRALRAIDNLVDISNFNYVILVESVPSGRAGHYTPDELFHTYDGSFTMHYADASSNESLGRNSIRSVITHEMIHNLGSDHDNYIECSNGEVYCGFQGPLLYGDVLSIQGSASYGHMSPQLKRLIGWLGEEQYIEISNEGVYTIYPYSDGVNTVKALFTPGFFFSVIYRQHINLDQHDLAHFETVIEKPLDDGVHVHHQPTGSSSNTMLIDLTPAEIVDETYNPAEIENIIDTPLRENEWLLIPEFGGIAFTLLEAIPGEEGYAHIYYTDREKSIVINNLAFDQTGTISIFVERFNGNDWEFVEHIVSEEITVPSGSNTEIYDFWNEDGFVPGEPGLYRVVAQFIDNEVVLTQRAVEIDVLGTCGNGIVEYKEQCDGVVLNDQTCGSLAHRDGVLACDAETCEYDLSQCESDRIFVTSQTWTADQIQNLGNADLLCQNAADTQNLGGTWKAWLSDSQTAAEDRLHHTNLPLTLLDETIIAHNWDDLLDIQLNAPIAIDETGLLQADEPVFTGTNGYGKFHWVRRPQWTYEKGSCNDWQSNNAEYTGTIGKTSATNYKWTNQIRSNSQDVTCDQPAHLYCVEQPPTCGDADDVCDIGETTFCITELGLSGIQSCNSYCSAFGACIPSDQTECSDGIDNDADGVTDALDPGCWIDPVDADTYDPNLDDESIATTQCQDGIDNDGDNDIDYPADNGCDSPQDNEEIDGGQTETECSDFLDNDGDGLIDYPQDPGCSSSGDNSEFEPTVCHIDLDQDGEVGFNDLVTVLGSWGELDGDINNDGTTDFGDLLLVLSNWGAVCDFDYVDALRVFVTSEKYSVSDDFVGVTGADELCTVHGQIVEQGSTWRAWISNSTTNPVNREDFTKANIPYVLVDDSETPIAISWNDLITCDGGTGFDCLLHKLNINETGDPLGDQIAWTGTSHDGTSDTDHCEDWQTGSGSFGRFGDTGKVNTDWTHDGTFLCSNSIRFYCFEYIEDQAYCGDGIQNGYEQCDDGNFENNDACTNECLINICGDGYLGPGEQCEAGDINGASCQDAQYSGFGAPSCDASCRYSQGTCDLPTIVALDGSGDYISIQEALNASEQGDTILVEPGVYNEGIDYPDKSIYLISSHGPETTIIDASEPQDTGIEILDVDEQIVIDGFTVRDGIGKTHLSLSIGECGGGIYTESSENVVLRNLIVTNNYAQFGGGICAYRTQFTFENIVIEDNEALDGGGLFLWGGPWTIEHSIVRNNFAVINAAMSVRGKDGSDQIRILNSLIHDNQATEKTSGISLGCEELFGDCTISIINSVIHSHMDLDPNHGTGITAHTDLTLYLQNSIIRDNFPINILATEFEDTTMIINAQYSNINGIVSVEGTYTEEQVVDEDPLWSGNYHLSPNSSMIDAGNNNFVTWNVDSDGQPRINNVVDIGIDEYY